MRRKYIIGLWTFIALTAAACCTIVTMIWNGWIGYMPPIEDLQNPIDKYATQVLSSDGKVIGTWNMNKDNRIHVPYDSISPYVVKALIATEDERFYEHSGIDFRALARAVVKRGILGQESAGGGSTITQQLAKQLYSDHAGSKFERMMQKPIEWVIALKLERYYTKEEIITMYLNYFDFLHNAVGIKMAANTYFSKEPKALDIAEAATLVGLCKNPSLYNPVRYAERAAERRNVVLRQMLKAGYISETEYEEIAEKPIELHFRTIDHKEGSAAYFREFLRKYMTAKRPQRENYPSWAGVQYHIDSIAWEQDPLYGWCNKNRKKDGSAYNIYTDGLKIRTSINSRMQRYAEEAVYAHVAKYLQPVFDRENRRKKNAPYSNLSQKQINDILNRSMRQSERWRAMREAGCSDSEIEEAFRKKTEMTVFSYHGDVDTLMSPLDSIRYYKTFLRAGFMSIDPRNGEVKAYVGGMDYEHFQYDMVMLGRRQVGSTIKPFLYSLAMDNGFTPCDMAPNVQQTYIVAGQAWTPRNASKTRYGENVTLRWGLQQSNNWISAYLISKLNPQQFVQLLQKYGIDSPTIHASMALCLGPCDVSVGEMVSAYTAFANNGIRCAPLFVTRIEDNIGNVLADFQPRMNEVISQEGAYKMLDMMRAVADGGTASRLRYKYGLNGDIAAKTGTTNNNSDAWFMGVTPELVSGCWVGGDDRDIHFSSMLYGQGATMALPIWAYYMKKVYADRMLGYDEKKRFDIPADFNPCANLFQDDLEEDGAGVEDVFE